MKRLWKFGASIAVIAVIGWTASACLNAKAAPLTTHNTYMVHGGDTLWSIVNANQSYDGQDRNEVVYEIKQLNRLRDSQIQPGQTIQMP